jgi:hypothetical protein
MVKLNLNEIKLMKLQRARTDSITQELHSVLMAYLLIMCLKGSERKDDTAKNSIVIVDTIYSGWVGK